MSTLLDTALQQPLEIGRDVHPQPVATACGHILRARSHEQLLEATLKAAEVLSRYLGALALTSYACRQSDPPAPPFAADRFVKPLAFGDFLELTQAIASSECVHPLRQQFDAMDARKKRQAVMERTAAFTLGKLLTFRNERGHDLAGINSKQAESFLKNNHIVESFLAALTSAECVLSLPLFLIEEQRKTGGKVMARVLLLMGETADPQPMSVQLATDVSFDGEPAISFGDSAGTVAPMLLWHAVEETGNSKLFVWDAVARKTVKYRTMDGLHKELNGAHHDRLCGLFSGTKAAAEGCGLAGGDSVMRWWLALRKSFEAANAQKSGWIPWKYTDLDTLKWYASHLTSDVVADPKAVIQQKLLDGRDRLQPFEIDQFILLFGGEAEVMARLGREMIDLRVRTGGEQRLDDRIECHQNVLQSLHIATDFFRRYVSVGELTVEALKQTSGTPDFVAMREAMINLFIHQDYADTRAPAQIDIAPGVVTFFNLGFSLAGGDEGGGGVKSYPRNPLIARALRLIGFAELAASGLRELQRVWQKADRRLPQVTSNEKTNSFTLVLDWRQAFQMQLPVSGEIAGAPMADRPSERTATQPNTTDAGNAAS